MRILIILLVLGILGIMAIPALGVEVIEEEEVDTIEITIKFPKDKFDVFLLGDKAEPMCWLRNALVSNLKRMHEGKTPPMDIQEEITEDNVIIIISARKGFIDLSGFKDLVTDILKADLEAHWAEEKNYIKMNEYTEPTDEDIKKRVKEKKIKRNERLIEQGSGVIYE